MTSTIETPKGSLLFEAFMRGYALNRGGFALQTNQQTLTYVDLYKRALEVSETIAPYVGAGPVGVLCEEGRFDVIAMLALSSLALPIVPVSTDDPANLVEQRLRLASVTHILVETPTPWSASLPTVAGTDEWTLVSMRSRCDLAQEATELVPLPDAQRVDRDTAYVLFTSGTTGRAKGVPVMNTSLHSFCSWMLTRYSLTTSERVIKLHRWSFDMAFMEAIVAFNFGATLCLTPLDSAGTIAKHLSRISPSWILITPSLGRALAEYFERRPSSLWTELRYLLFGGEALDTTLAMRLRNLFPSAQLENYYGPTEAAIAVCAYSLPQDTAVEGATVPLGLPQGDTQFRILSQDGDPRRGELLLAGPQIFRGYLGSEENGCFLYQDEKLWYRTGDIVLMGPAGLQFVGRTDRQLKIRGQRVSLEAIESLVRSHPGVCEATAVVTSGRRGTAIEVVFSGPAAMDSIREHLISNLPASLTNLQIRHAELMLGPTGKVRMPSGNGKSDA